MIHLQDGSIVPVEKNELPIKLPDDIDLNQNGNPLEITRLEKHIHQKTGKPALEKLIHWIHS